MPLSKVRLQGEKSPASAAEAAGACEARRTLLPPPGTPLQLHRQTGERWRYARCVESGAWPPGDPPHTARAPLGGRSPGQCGHRGPRLAVGWTEALQGAHLAPRPALGESCCGGKRVTPITEQGDVPIQGWAGQSTGSKYYIVVT